MQLNDTLTTCTLDNGSTFELSTYQTEILRWIRDGRGHAVVNAVAGSGKTTTLVMAASLLTGRGLFLAFNKHAADQLGVKLAGTKMVAKTIHSLGFAAIRKAFGKVRVDATKYRKIARRLARGLRHLTGQEQWECQLAACKLADLARVSLCSANEEGLQAVVDHHALDLPRDLEGDVFALTLAMLEAGKAHTSEVDFTDMLWFVAAHDLSPQRFSWVFVDEAQDLSPAQLHVVRGALTKGGRLLAVGDPRQAIYGFAGADADSFYRIQRTMEAAELPLSVCYRCPSSHLDLARQIVPSIEDAPGCSEGTVERWEAASWTGKVHEGDLVLCRVTAPLLTACYSLISDGISAVVRGREIGQGLVALAKKVFEDGGFEDFAPTLTAWADAECVDLARKHGDDADSRVEALMDRVECLRVIRTRGAAEDFAGYLAGIEELFSDKRASVTLSTVHRAKGLEADRVAILHPGKLGHSSWSRTEWQEEQERNLKYVALTRAKECLAFVH